MRIGIVVPGEIVEEIIGFLNKEFPEIEAIPFPYDAIMDIPDILSGKQNRVDSFLFLGNTARRYAEKAIPHTSEWLTIPRSTSALLRILFRAEVAGHHMHIATDLDNEKFFNLAFHEIGFSPEETSLEIIHVPAYNEGLLVQEANQIEKLYKQGKISFCITMFYKVRDILSKRGVPVYILQPSFDDIRNGLQRLVLSHERRLNRDSQAAILSIHIDIPRDTLPENSDYRMALEKLAVTKEIFRAARNINAACIEQPPSDYILFTSAKDIENATEHFHRLPLLQSIAETTAFTVSIGIGYGPTAAEARYHAFHAMNHAILTGGNKAFLMGKELFCPVPMSANDQNIQEKKERPIDEQFLYLSKKSKVSVRIIANLYQACRDTGRQRFTAAELADLTGVTPRTINRILAKLIDHHLAQDVGRRFKDKTGRPSRIIEILFEPKKHIKK